MINTSRLNLEKMIRDASRISEFDAKRLKEMLNHEFPRMQSKINSLAQEVFDEVMQHELALTGLSDVNLETALPEPDPYTADMTTHRSMLRKMTSL